MCYNCFLCCILYACVFPGFSSMGTIVLQLSLLFIYYFDDKKLRKKNFEPLNFCNFSAFTYQELNKNLLLPVTIVITPALLPAKFCWDHKCRRFDAYILVSHCTISHRFRACLLRTSDRASHLSPSLISAFVWLWFWPLDAPISGPRPPTRPEPTRVRWTSICIVLN